MKTIPTLLFVSSIAFGCASTQGTGQGLKAVALRGDVLVHGPSVKAVVAGPASIHAYSAFAGGALYAAQKVSGTDSDCQGKTPQAASTALGADTVTAFDVAEDQVVCLATTTSRSFELLWHANKDRPAPTAQLLAHGHH